MSYTTGKVIVLSSHSPDSKGDADLLECRYGLLVAQELLHEGLISAVEFLGLCQEAAQATDEVTRHGRVATARPSWAA